MSKFCGKCGTETKDGKCPKCDKTVKKTEKVKAEKVDTKKTENKKVEVVNEKASFAWAILGFFVPIAGLVLFIVFMNKRKDISKKAGIGALVGVIKNIIVFILSYTLSFVSFYSLFNYIENNPINIDPIISDIEDIIEDNIDKEDEAKVIELTDINTDKPLKKGEFSLQSLNKMENKEYELEDYNLTISRPNDYTLIIKEMDSGNIIKQYNNVLFAEYTSFDCSGWDFIVVQTQDKVYSINLRNLETSELNNKYKYYSIVNHGYTCGGSHVIVGKDTDGTIYDLNGDRAVEFENLYSYDDPDNWINYITRGYKLDGHYGTAKVIIKSSEGDSVRAIVDVTGKTYIYTYDVRNVSRKSTLDLLTARGITDSNVVTKITVDKNDRVTLVYDNGEEFSFDYADIDY
jgi:hypothetical protein